MNRNVLSLASCIALAWSLGACDVPLSDQGEYFKCDEDGTCPSGYVCEPVEGVDACVPTDESTDADVEETRDTTDADVEDTRDATDADVEEARDATDTDADSEIEVNPNADLLFVIDNSAGMCAKQLSFADKFSRLFEEIDFGESSLQVGVTTTHKTPDHIPQNTFPTEFGVLQSKPTPLPGFHCRRNIDMVQQSINRAVACTENPENYEGLATFSDDQEKCITGEGACDISGFDIANLYPPPSAYREIPAVLESENYSNAGSGFDKEQFVEDLKCLSLVGTQGWAIEKGLGAAKEAVSEEKLSGASAPNAGFIRAEASFGVVFLTDENDCTHGGEIDESNLGACLGAVCAFENRVDLAPEDSKLVSIGELQDQLLNNLGKAKQRNVSPREVFVGGIYGEPERYDGPDMTMEDCQDAEDPLVPNTCNAELFSAKSGDRYARFIDTFPEASQYPPSTTTPEGRICLPGDVEDTLAEMGARLNSFLNQGH